MVFGCSLFFSSIFGVIILMGQSRRCIVDKCLVRDGMGVTLFSFGGKARRDSWVAALRLEKVEKIPASWRVCAVSIILSVS